jgi:hypothetical protein
LDVVPSAIRVVSGSTVNVKVMVKNEGTAYETFDVSLYYDGNIIGTQTITDMVPGSTKLLTFSWDTSGVSFGNYMLKAEASIVPGETDIVDNTLAALVRIGPETLMKVEPSLIQVQRLDKTFQVNVTINDLWEGWRTVGVQFRLLYNDTLLEVVNVTEGPFMQDARWNLHGTFFVYFVEKDGIYGPHVLVGIMLYPNETGYWNAFPSGSGVVATITFKAVYQERGLEKPPLTCSLKLVDTMIVDDELLETPMYMEHGLYEVYPTHIGDFNYDGKVDMKDIVRVARAFGSYPDHPRWDPVCDTNADNKIDMRDIIITARGFGWTSIYDP